MEPEGSSPHSQAPATYPEPQFTITETKYSLLCSFRSYEYTDRVNTLTETVSLIVGPIFVH
jgi:hypothetical protein